MALYKYVYDYDYALNTCCILCPCFWLWTVMNLTFMV